MIHSPLGASSAYRWMSCPGSVALIATLPDAEDTEAGDYVGPRYRQEGTAAHELASETLRRLGEPWEYADATYAGILGSTLDVHQIQTYVDLCRSLMPSPSEWGEHDRAWVEHHVGEKEALRPHPLFFGTVDFAMLTEEKLTIVDFKYGEGIIVDVVDNPQVMYYAYGLLLEDWSILGDFPVELIICQPRVHGEPEIKPWKTTAGHILEWGRETLIPMMKRAQTENSFSAGEHCRFCPAKLACPLLKGMFKVAATINTEFVKDAHGSTLGQEWNLIAPVEMYIRAVKEETLSRLMASVKVEGTKLIAKRANRIWKSGAEAEVRAQFGAAAMEAPAMKSPPEIEKLGQKGKAVVKEWAFTPQTGVTVASSDSKHPEVKVEPAAETYAHYAGAKDAAQ